MEPVPQTSEFSIVGRTALVTGAAGGLGRAFALSLAEAGASVIGVDRDVDGLAQTCLACAGSPGAVSSVVADVSSAADIDAMFAAVMRLTDTVDILINNAGLATLPGRTHEIAIADWDRALSTNLRSMFLVTRVVLPVMLRRKAGSIINMSSYLGLVGAFPGFPITAIPYAASKAGVIGFTRQLAVEYAADGIRANAVAPGWHGGTNLGRELKATATPEQVARFEGYITRAVPMGRRGTPLELCSLVRYLASDASRYLTGQVMAHDGGITAA